MYTNSCMVDVKRLPNCYALPHYAAEGDAGADAYAAHKGSILVRPGDTKIIPLGFSVAIQDGFFIAVLPRSGLASKGIHVANSPGVVDKTYRGECGVIVYNAGVNNFTIARGDRICQIALLPVYNIVFNEVDELSETERGAGGFGSTGT